MCFKPNILKLKLNLLVFITYCFQSNSRKKQKKKLKNYYGTCSNNFMYYTEHEKNYSCYCFTNTIF